MTKELFEKLKPFEEKLHTAYYNDFVRLTDSKMKEQLAGLHMEAFGHGGNIMGGCNRCVINALKNLGREYFIFKKKLEEELAKEQEQVQKELELKAEQPENKAVTKPKTKKATAANKKK